MGNINYDEMKQKYLESDVVLLASIRENCATTMLEALSYGKPVISLKMTGMALLNNESCGRFIEGNTNFEFRNSLANNIIYFIKNKDKLDKFAAGCILTAQKYTWTKNIKYYNNIYKMILK